MAAANDLEEITEYLFEKSPENAAQIVRKIHETPFTLEKYPNLERLGKKDGTRELVMAPLPYIVIYQIKSDALYILRILHGAQDWHG